MINDRKFVDPEILVVKFGSEDIITSSPDDRDPYEPDQFE